MDILIYNINNDRYMSKISVVITLVVRCSLFYVDTNIMFEKYC